MENDKKLLKRDLSKVLWSNETLADSLSNIPMFAVEQILYDLTEWVWAYPQKFATGQLEHKNNLDDLAPDELLNHLAEEQMDSWAYRMSLQRGYRGEWHGEDK